MNASEPDFGHLKRLWTLKTVVDTGNLKRASLRNKVSVSAISQGLTALEETLGRKLFVKKDRRLVPTQYCLEIIHSVEPAFRVFDELEKLQARESCVPRMDWLNFGTSHCVASEVLPRLVGQLKGKLPGLKLKLKVGRCEALLGQVRNGDLCMALIAGYTPTAEVTAYPIYEDRLGIFTASRLTANQDAEAQIEDGIAALGPDVGGHPAYYSQFIRSFACKVTPSVTCNSYETLYEMAIHGAAPAILPERLALRQAGALREIRPPRTAKSPANAGRFTVHLVSQAICDPREDQFLLAELRSLL